MMFLLHMPSLNFHVRFQANPRLNLEAPHVLLEDAYSRKKQRKDRIKKDTQTYVYVYIYIDR